MLRAWFLHRLVRPEPVRSMTTCRVSFFDPSRFKGRLSTSLAGKGFDRLNVGRTTTLLKGAPPVVAAMEPSPATTLVIAEPLVVTAPCAATSSLSLREVSLPPGVQRFKSFSSPRTIASEYVLQR